MFLGPNSYPKYSHVNFDAFWAGQNAEPFK